MKTSKTLPIGTPVLAFMTAWVALAASGCSSAQSAGTAPEADLNAATAGPAIVMARPVPETVELNRDFQPMRPAEVIADIKDFKSKVSSARLQFANIPLEIPMENLGGSTWRAQLTPRQLELLSVSGHTIHYQANVVARDDAGKVGTSKIPVELAIKTPDLVSSNSQGSTAAGG